MTMRGKPRLEQWFADILAYSYQVLVTWWAIAGGTVAFIISIFEKIKKRSVPWNIVAIVLLFTLLPSSYDIWLAEHKKLQAAVTDTQPILKFAYDNTSQFVMSPDDRPKEYQNWAVRLKISTSRSLRNAKVKLLSIYRNEDSGTSTSLNYDYKPQFGWYTGPSAFQAITFSSEEYVILFYGRNSGDELSLFTDPKDRQAELGKLKDLPKGTYKMTIMVEADDITNGISQVMIVRWPGRMGGFHMEITND